jgi:hypothetical protein
VLVALAPATAAAESELTGKLVIDRPDQGVNVSR